MQMSTSEKKNQAKELYHKMLKIFNEEINETPERIIIGKIDNLLKN
jgi:hypothetical protein